MNTSWVKICLASARHRWKVNKTPHVSANVQESKETFPCVRFPVIRNSVDLTCRPDPPDCITVSLSVLTRLLVVAETLSWVISACCFTSNYFSSLTNHPFHASLQIFDWSGLQWKAHVFIKSFKVFTDVHGKQTVGSECYLQTRLLSWQFAALCDLLKHDALHILHWNEGELPLDSEIAPPPLLKPQNSWYFYVCLWVLFYL